MESWHKVYDGLYDHERVLALQHPESMALYHSGLCYCSRNRTDGLIPVIKVRQLTLLKRPEKFMKDLVNVGLWEDEGVNIRVWRYTDKNISSEEIRAKERQWSEAGKKAAQARWGSDQPSESHTIQDANRIHPSMRFAYDRHAIADAIPNAIAMPDKDLEKDKNLSFRKGGSGGENTEAKNRVEEMLSKIGKPIPEAPNPLHRQADG